MFNTMRIIQDLSRFGIAFTYRMNYPQYIERELCIGSGAIEAAHRTIVQQRMKRSGQRWTEIRVQNMLNLKVANLSGQWNKIVDLMRNYKKAA